jgi:hypothetical protein
MKIRFNVYFLFLFFIGLYESHDVDSGFINKLTQMDPNRSNMLSF